MGQESRKATDVLLDLESKVSLLLDIIKSQDLSIKILSNKLNDVIARLGKQQEEIPKFVVEAVHTNQPAVTMPFPQLPGDPSRNIPITAESKIPQDNAPQGFRRSSRPETYAGDNAVLPTQELKMPTQMPNMNLNRPNMPPAHHTDNVAPSANLPPPPTTFINREPPSQLPMNPAPNTNQIPVMQRCVDRNGKSIFLADVELTDLSSNESILKTRTNGTGKWMASLVPGSYRVFIKKRGSSVQLAIESVQDIQIDGKQSPLELPMLIIK